MSDTEPYLSVVVVSRNEETRIEACIESILEVCADGPPFEVILVDSNSSDETVDRASEYPVSVLRIPSDELSTPGAGRYVGTERASGEFILFVDGDMTLVDSWLTDAIELVQARADIAGVTGFLNETTGTTTQEIDALRGVALYDAAALATVGGFDPFLQSCEDTDLGYRLQAAGYTLLRIPTVVAIHPFSESLGEPLRRWRNGYFHGVGQAVRKSATSPKVCARHLYSLRYPLLAGGWLGIGVALGLRDRRGLSQWASASALAFTVEVLREGLARPTVYSVSFLLTLLGLVLGSRRPPPPAAEYPLDRIEVVSTHPGALGA